jgi:hypothetical protein
MSVDNAASESIEENNPQFSGSSVLENANQVVIRATNSRDGGDCDTFSFLPREEDRSINRGYPFDFENDILHWSYSPARF